MDFLISNFNTIFLITWCLFSVIVAVRYFQPDWLKNVSHWWLISIAVFLHLLYGSLATLLQYIVWGGTEFTKVFLVSPIAPEVPLPGIIDWIRPFFSGEHGYFALYSLHHFFLSTIVLFFITGLFVIFFKIWAYYRPDAFVKGDIAIITLSFLIAGYYGAIVLVPLAFLIAVIISSLGLKFSKINQFSLATSFLIALPFAFIYGVYILKYFDLYYRLKL